MKSSTYTTMGEETEDKTQARNGPSGGGRPRAAFHEFPPRPDCRTQGSVTTTTHHHPTPLTTCYTTPTTKFPDHILGVSGPTE